MSDVSYDSFEYAFKRKYEKDQISSIYKNHFKIFDTTKKIVNILDPKKKPLANLSDNHKLKIIFQVYSSKELFKIFYDSKSPEFKEIFKLILWGESEKRYFAHKLEKKFKANIMNQFSSYGYSGLLEEYQLFSFERDYDYSTKSYQYNLFLPKQISKIIKQSIEEKPESYYLKKYDKEIKSELFYQNNDVILKEISLFKKYLDSKDNKDVTLSNIKMPLKKDFVYIRQNCIVGDEFFSKKDKDLNFIREELLYKFFLSSFYTKKEIEISPLLLLKNTIDNLKSKSTFITFNLFNHLKNKNNLSDFNFSIKQNTLFIKDFFDFIETLKESEFYSIESIIDYFILRDLELNIFSKYDADRMYIPIEFRGYKEKIKIDDDEIYSLAIIKPLIKGMFFLFASLGIFDIHYSLPSISKTEKESIDSKYVKELQYISPYDSINFVTLTPLGLYLLGLKDSYKVNIEEDDTKIILNEKSLTIKVLGKSKIKTIFFPEFSEQISENEYKVTYESFLKSCVSKKDLKNKINLFKKEVSKEPTKIWTDFFDEILSKFDPFEIKKNFNVFEIARNKELLDILSKDSVLKELILKVEGYKIAIETENLTKVKKRMEHFGYITNFF